MNRTDALYQSFLEILREELVPAMGCTEPIAIAYAAAQARAVLGKRPERVRIEVSGNIIKNVKSVIVPHTGSMHGIAAAAAAGIIAGREDRELEVLDNVAADLNAHALRPLAEHGAGLRRGIGDGDRLRAAHRGHKLLPQDIQKALVQSVSSVHCVFPPFFRDSRPQSMCGCRRHAAARPCGDCR